MIRISTESFSGGGGDVAGTLVALAQSAAKIAASTIADLTDNSGGTANGALADVPLCSTAPAVGDSVPTKASAETALGTVRNGLTEIAAKIVAISARVPAFSPTNNVGGTTADGTIAAVSVTTTNDNTGPRVARTGVNTLITAYRNLIRELAFDVNALATACGVDGVTGKAGVTTRPTADRMYQALSTDTGTAPADSSGSVTSAQFAASLTAMRENIAELAARLNAITSDTSPAALVIVE